MRSTQVKKRLRLGLALLAGGMAVAAAPAAAQTSYGAYQENPGDALSRHLRTLAESPRNLPALIGAGKAALELGDAQSAATFYARAEELAPRDGRIKAGLGSAFLQMEQAQAALKFFEDARALGAPEGEYAADRGLANDLLGNQAQAQRDYAVAMRTHDSDELRRRMALSKAISGDRAGALAAIDDQLRRQDRAAWRVRAFVLALTGDATGATEAVRAVMPMQAAAMQPFLARLPALRPAERASAVHFGHFPDRPVQVVETTPQQPAVTQPPRPQQYASARTAVPQTTKPRAAAPPAKAQPRRVERAEKAQPEPSRRSSGLTWAEERALLRGSGFARPRGVSKPVETRPEPARTEPPIRVAKAEPRLPPPSAAPSTSQRVRVTSAPVQQPVSARPVQGPPANAGAPAVVATNAVPLGGPANILPPAVTSRPPVEVASSAASAASDAAANAPSSLLPPAVASAPVESSPAVATITPPPSTLSADAAPLPAAEPAAAASGLAAIAATIKALPDEQPKEEAKEPVQLARAEAKPEPKKAAAPKQETVAEEKAPSRHWVQIASASDALAAAEYKRLKGKAPKLLGDTSGWKASFRSTNRVLVGPFKDRKEAQGLVNALAKANIDAVPWTSPEGQEIEKLAAK